MKLMVAMMVLVLTACSASPRKSATTAQPLATNDVYPERFQVLDQLLAEQKYDALLTTLVPERLKPSFGNLVVNRNLTTDLIWLKPKAEEGHVPLMYVLAYRILPKDPLGAEKLYARARTWAFLDAKECRSDPRFPWSILLERTFPELHQERLKNPMVYLQSVDEALQIEAVRVSRPSAAWYCEVAFKGNMLPPELAATARKEKAKEMREYNQRKLVSGKDD